MAWLKGLVAAAFVFAVTMGWLFFHLYNLPDNRSEETYVLIAKGAGLRQVAEQLTEAGVIIHPLPFCLAARFSKLDKHLKAGEYLLPPKISMRKVLETISRGEVVYRRLTLPEGLTSAQMLEIIADDPYLTGDVTLTVKEGDLLPETYSYVRGDSRNGIVFRAREAMQNALEEVWSTSRSDVIGSREQLLILASIVEKETGIAAERADVASVFVNRLRLGMKLQTDPTVIYALTGGKKELGRPLYKKDLSIDHPYNTYKYYGLPPGPICNPGRKALEAAANPADSDYLYFVASGNGGHRFARHLDEHNRNVNLYKKSLIRK